MISDGRWWIISAHLINNLQKFKVMKAKLLTIAFVVGLLCETKQMFAQQYNEEYIEYVGKEFTIGKKFEGDIYSMIIFDFPHSIANIKPEQIKNRMTEAMKNKCLNCDLKLIKRIEHFASDCFNN